MFAMTAEEASEAGARCRQEADKCKTKVGSCENTKCLKAPGSFCSGKLGFQRRRVCATTTTTSTTNVDITLSSSRPSLL